MTVTLETLRADFEATIDGMIFNLLVSGKWNHEFATRLVAALEVAKRTPSVLADEEATFNLRGYVSYPKGFAELAELLIVAEKHGLEAAMLFKLSDGAIDPRKEAE